MSRWLGVVAAHGVQVRQKRKKERNEATNEGRHVRPKTKKKAWRESNSARVSGHMAHDAQIVELRKFLCGAESPHEIMFIPIKLCHVIMRSII